MEQYINKSTLVAEIERILEELYELLPDAGKVEKGIITISEACNTGKYTALESFKDYIDTLEVKEVDLEEEMDKHWDEWAKVDGFHSTEFAKHFFELGMNVKLKGIGTTRMTDKEKIREEVEKLKSQLTRGACSSQLAMETRCKEEAYNEVLAMLDTMQEEPVGKVWHNMSEPVEKGRNILIIDPKDFYGAVLRKGSSALKNNNKERYVAFAYIDDLLKL